MKELPSNLEWQKWGEVDPLFGVASWKDKQRNGAAPWTDEDFYQLGTSDWKDFLEHWTQYDFSSDSCLEIGCGAGRITKQLTLTFQQVHAIDVSQKMLDYAQNQLKDSSITFHLSEGTNIPLPDGSVSAVFSAHVFQHFDSLDVADIYFSEIARVLQENGTFMIHLPISSWPANSALLKALYTFQKSVGNAIASGRRTFMKMGLIGPPMRALSYPVDHLYRELLPLGFSDIEISIFVTKSNSAPHSFIFGRKQSR